MLICYHCWVPLVPFAGEQAPFSQTLRTEEGNWSSTRKDKQEGYAKTKVMALKQTTKTGS